MSSNHIKPLNREKRSSRKEREVSGILEAELKTYEQEREHLLDSEEGKFVLIKDETIVGLFDTWDEARQAGLQRYLLKPFLVHQVQRREPVLRLRSTPRVRRRSDD